MSTEQITGSSVVENTRGSLLEIKDPESRLRVIDELVAMLDIVVSETYAFEMPQTGEAVEDYK